MISPKAFILVVCIERRHCDFLFGTIIYRVPLPPTYPHSEHLQLPNLHSLAWPAVCPRRIRFRPDFLFRFIPCAKRLEMDLIIDFYTTETRVFSLSRKAGWRLHRQILLRLHSDRVADRAKPGPLLLRAAHFLVEFRPVQFPPPANESLWLARRFRPRQHSIHCGASSDSAVAGSFTTLRAWRPRTLTSPFKLFAGPTVQSSCKVPTKPRSLAVHSYQRHAGRWLCADVVFDSGHRFYRLGQR